MRHLVTLACLLVLHATLHAQDYGTWPRAQRSPFYHSVDIVTTYQPGVRHSCRAIAIDDDALTCEAKKGHAPIVYQREDVATIIQPPYHSPTGVIVACLLGGAYIALLVVNPLGALAVGVIAMGIWAVAESNPFPTRDSYRPEHHDILLYQQPGTQLSVRLR